MIREKVVEYLNYRRKNYNHYNQIDLDFITEFIHFRSGKGIDSEQLKKSMHLQVARELFIERMINFLVDEFDIKVETEPVDQSMVAFLKFLNVNEVLMVKKYL